MKPDAWTKNRATCSRLQPRRNRSSQSTSFCWVGVWPAMFVYSESMNDLGVPYRSTPELTSKFCLSLEFNRALLKPRVLNPLRKRPTQ